MLSLWIFKYKNNTIARKTGTDFKRVKATVIKEQKEKDPNFDETQLKASFVSRSKNHKW